MTIRNCSSISPVLILAIVLVFTSPGVLLARGKPVQPPGNNPPGNPVIVFQDGHDILVADADGSNATVVHRLQVVGPASWCSPDGTDIVFKDSINGQNGVYHLTVVRVDVDGNRTLQVGEPRLIVATAYVGFWFVRCSPVPVGTDRQMKVAYNDYELQPDGSRPPYDNIYVVNLGADGGPPAEPEQRMLVVDGLQQGGIEIANLSWSPDGDRIVFASTLWSIPADFVDYDVEIVDLTCINDEIGENCFTSLVRGVTDSPLQGIGSFLTPGWSNGGDQIAIDSNYGLWVIPVLEPASAKPVQYFQTENIVRADVGWSPDDKQLIYLRNPRRGMCGEGDSRKVKGTAIGLSNVNLDGIQLIDNCDEIAIVRGGRNPDWWRGALCGNGARRCGSVR